MNEWLNVQSQKVSRTTPWTNLGIVPRAPKSGPASRMLLPASGGRMGSGNVADGKIRCQFLPSCNRPLSTVTLLFLLPLEFGPALCPNRPGHQNVADEMFCKFPD